ncbi:dihydropteroate synthase [Pseudoalteromonas tunicata]|jgi:dihydropteroate synthase|uniref:Dihydropteroate synthase n=1 Tax=Pseudoalteromonas tunicata D2 TaxID=87626 RepID=A4CD77_9GAMM|nr:dihydropteroate synthase [Pseudoalteromonas tunicata]ATC94026.1 dihydropteroate synthase [Pseudoalteromonas tunicata]AXT29809.1 dihydropteroate synthase [Pseudoalteromonas tunicata]EAR27520.1 Dihydropteroate synthase (DHPS) (Dihydropteroate pyrophosphorylase) [Pseudoalteromonas tunicata D2]
MSLLQLKNGRVLDLSQPHIMGILNTTPDSFSDGGQHNTFDNAVIKAKQMLAEGATIIDIGGESTRPNAPDVALEEELQRTIPVIKALRAQSDCIISIDTSKAQVMAQAIASGADIINDVRALQEPGALEIAAAANVPVCLMHMQGQPRTMQANPYYENLIEDIQAFFQQRIDACQQAGIKLENIILDPGFGFGKTLNHNYELLKRLDEFNLLGCEVLAGLSRKSMIGNLLNKPTEQRLAGSLAGALIAMQKGAKIIRVHDVAQTVDVLKVWQATEQGIKREQ